MHNLPKLGDRVKVPFYSTKNETCWRIGTVVGFNPKSGAEYWDDRETRVQILIDNFGMLNYGYEEITFISSGVPISVEELLTHNWEDVRKWALRYFRGSSCAV